MRLFIEKELAADQPVVLTSAHTHYLRNVMRATPGDKVLLFNGRDGEWESSIETLAKGSGTAVPRALRCPQRLEPGPWLLFAPLKREPQDFLIQKAVELGVSALQPVRTKFTNTVRINQNRMVSHAIAAAEQCERLTVPEVREMQKYTFLLENWPEDRYLLVCAEREAAQPIDDVLRAAPKSGTWGILTGPEGGFALSELEQLQKLPFVRLVSLGPRILRAETAAIAALTCWQSVLGDWNDHGY
ncbi:MAG: 16S rRNA (uracil(1498)-N(3))-methyltransferase [Rhodospirillaceae bacterium]|nr:16S rRNA (uracil(1498)-N(3))-methyltransferase [Rhodospirillaceae bacterium]